MESEARNTHRCYYRLAENINRVVKGQQSSIRLLLAAFMTGGHVLLEDFPGTGKTTLAKALARSVGLRFQRIQFTPDLLPSDILGVSIFNQQSQAFELHKGPIFTDILLADEINRASPRTQSALLEAMGESQVSLDGNLHRLDDLFFVIATQNPIEYHGTYPLPEAQMDRFSLRLALGYVPLTDEIAIVSAQSAGHPLDLVAPCINRDEIMQTRIAIGKVHVADEIMRYIVEIITATRTRAGIDLGASPRASLTLMKLSKALALFDSLDFVTPDHIQELAVPVIAHRIVVNAATRFSGNVASDIVADILREIRVPR